MMMADKIRCYEQRIEDSAVRAAIRYRAIGDDWNRLRDIESSWARLRNIGLWIVLFSALISASSVLFGWW